MQYPDFVSVPDSLHGLTKGGFWESDEWRAYQAEAGLSKATFSTQAVNPEVGHVWTVGTNLGAVIEWSQWQVTQPRSKCFHSPKWTNAFHGLLQMALIQHARYVRVSALSPEGWREHIRRGHQLFCGGCKACLLGRATGHQHRKVRHPAIDCLSVDIAGPMKVKGADPDGRGRYPPTFKYLAVGVYRHPKLEGFVDRASEQEMQDAMDDPHSLFLQEQDAGGRSRKRLRQRVCLESRI